MTSWLTHSLCNIRNRCNNPDYPEYRYWGGRGIKCLLTSRHEILDAIGARPSPRHSIDRIDNNGHYEVGNIRWATKEEQAANKNLSPFTGIFWNKWRDKWVAQYKSKYLCISESFADCLATKLLYMEKGYD